MGERFAVVVDASNQVEGYQDCGSQGESLWVTASRDSQGKVELGQMLSWNLIAISDGGTI